MEDTNSHPPEQIKFKKTTLSIGEDVSQIGEKVQTPHKQWLWWGIDFFINVITK